MIIMKWKISFWQISILFVAAIAGAWLGSLITIDVQCIQAPCPPLEDLPLLIFLGAFLSSTSNTATAAPIENSAASSVLTVPKEESFENFTKRISIETNSTSNNSKSFIVYNDQAIFDHLNDTG